jgi:two-component system OmpR family response regulator
VPPIDAASPGSGAAGPHVPEVLVVEDDPDVFRCLVLALQHHGFAVRQAGGGRQAVEEYRRHRGSIDLVLLDVQMPGLDGPQTFTLLREIDPHVRCVFMSGNTGRYSAEELIALGAARVLSKPFASMAGLAQTLRLAAGHRP